MVEQSNQPPTPSNKMQDVLYNRGDEDRSIKITFLKIPLSKKFFKKVWRFLCIKENKK